MDSVVKSASSIRRRGAHLKREWGVSILDWTFVQSKPSLYVEWRLPFCRTLALIGSVWQQQARVGGIAQVCGQDLVRDLMP